MKSDEFIGMLQKDDVIRESASSTDFDELGNKLGDIAGDVKEITSALKEVLATAEAKDHMKMTLENVRYTTDMLREILAQNEMRVNAIMRNVESLTGSLNSIAVGNQQNMNEIIANIRLITEDLRMQTPVIAENLKNVTGDIDDIVGGNKSDINDTIKSLRAVTAKLETTVDNMNDITGQIKSGEGTVGKLIYDNKTIDNMNETLTSLKNTMGKLDKMKVYLSFEGQHNFEESENKGAFRLRLVPSDKRYYLLGLETHPNGRDSTTKVSRKYTQPGYGEHSQDYATQKQSTKMSLHSQQCMPTGSLRISISA
ncbi:MAG: methyl-accepting chemotaxis protein [Geovibrio sp.]|nr:methyl-accepting chemotaxis protein [Geovibrio sp.]